ncbi:MAG: agmatine deiminase family protein [Acidobacteriia bacterium]|nr:agmatine deiminase family protein [Terriglobia bacterium]
MANKKRETRNEKLGFRMPAEWEPHSGTWLAWPHNKTDWPGKFAPIPWVYAEIVRHLARHERVYLIVQNAKAREDARKVLTRAHVPLDNVDFFLWPTNRGWLRDTGAIFVSDGKRLTALDWLFNAWAKYDDWQLDDKLPARIAARLKLPRVQPIIQCHPERVSTREGPAVRKHRIVLEGGSIDVNGRGTLLTTEECLLSTEQARNPGLTRTQYEEVFEEYLGVRKTIWLNRGIAGDDTHGHVDDIARFVSPDTVVAPIETDRSDPNYDPLLENVEILRRATDQDGRPLTVLELPMPAPVWFNRQRLPASYANFYICNGRVLVPTFDDPNDRVALNLLAHVLPGRQIIPIYCGDLVIGLGTLHCMTQQQPAL